MWPSGWLFCSLYSGCDLTLPKLRELNLFGWRNVSINGNCGWTEARLARVGWRVTVLLKKNRESLANLNTRINRSYLSFQNHALAVGGWSGGRKMSWEATAWMWVIDGGSQLGMGWWPVLTGTYPWAQCFPHLPRGLAAAHSEWTRMTVYDSWGEALAAFHPPSFPWDSKPSCSETRKEGLMRQGSESSSRNTPSPVTNAEAYCHFRGDFKGRTYLRRDDRGLSKKLSVLRTLQ